MNTPTHFRKRTCALYACVCLSLLIASCSGEASPADPNEAFEGLTEREPGSPENAERLESDDGPIGPDDPFCTEDCGALDGACVVGVCGPNGECETQPRVDGSACDDGDLCTLEDTCVAGVCESVPKACTSDVCMTSTCDPETATAAF